MRAARELASVVRRLRDETERMRRIAPPIVDRLRETRLCRLVLPAEVHGHELTPVEALEVYEALAGVEASVAWIAWNNSLACLFARYLERSARAEIFGDPSWLYAGSTRPSGRAAIEGEGYRVEGRWSLVSGCELADWLMFLCVVEENGRPRITAAGTPELRFAFVPRRDCEIIDTWHSGGLRGTGSHDVVVASKRVSRRYTVAPVDPIALETPLGHVPIICNMAAGYAAQVLGMARAAIDTLTGLAKTKLSADPALALGERPAALVAIAQHDAAVAAARAHLHACTAALWDEVRRQTASLANITALWSAAHHASVQGKSAFDAMFDAAGTTSLYTSSPLERAHRDLHAMERHVVAQPHWLEDAGRVKLGKSPTQPLYTV